MNDASDDKIDRSKTDLLKQRFQRGMLVLLGLLLALCAGEIAARFTIRWRWSPDRIEAMTTHRSTKGLYTNHPNLPYVLTPNYKSHNSYGFKGKEFQNRKSPGVMRIVAIGGSSTYGLKKPYASVLEQLLNDAGICSEVLNAGVPGWVSIENLLNLQLRVLPLEPDLVIVYQGRNEILPQAYNNFREDYSHYRKADYSFSTTNYLHKPAFRVSNLFMLLSVYPVDRFGWSSRDENPVYGTIRFENRPTADELIRNLSDPAPTRVYRNNVESMVLLLKERNISIVLGTMAFRAEKIATYGILTDEPETVEALRAQVERNNHAVREIAATHQLPVAEMAALANEPQLFYDDVHVSEEGHIRRATIIFDTIREQGIFKVAETPSARGSTLPCCQGEECNSLSDRSEENTARLR